jgi:hypothetical protein
MLIPSALTSDVPSVVYRVYSRFGIRFQAFSPGITVTAVDKLHRYHPFSNFFGTGMLPHHSLSGGRSKEPFGVATDYGLDGRGVGVRVPVRVRIVFSPRRPDRIWGPSSFLSNGYRWEAFPGGNAAGAWSWPLTSNKCRNQEYMDLHIHSLPPHVFIS